MVRGVIVAISLMFVAATGLLIAGATIEPLGEHVKTYDSIDDGSLDGTKVINDVYAVAFKWAPMILIFGIGVVWAVAWYIRRENPRRRVGP